MGEALGVNHKVAGSGLLRDNVIHSQQYLRIRNELVRWIWKTGGLDVFSESTSCTIIEGHDSCTVLLKAFVKN